MTMVTENSSQVHMLTLSCSNTDCLTKLRIGRFLKNPVTRTGALQFCPICGGKAMAHTDEDETYWEALARAYGAPVEAIIAVHSIWSSHEEPVFKKFFDTMMAEAHAK